MITLNIKNDKKKIETEKAILKFFYEIKLRKREFINECVKYDLDFSSKITKIYFEIILDKFTTYPKRNEKELIIQNFLINDTFVNYLDICNIKYTEDYFYQDLFLVHLNSLKEQNELNNVNLNSEKISRIVDIKPLQLLNYQLAEENFIIKVAKKVMDYILLNSNNTQTDEYYNKVFAQFDFDVDNKFTIGELNNFLTHTGNTLHDYDLRYLFEFFKIDDGRLSKTSLFEFIFEYSSKNYNNPANTNFVKDQKEIFSEEELKDDKKIQIILQNNYFITIIKESLQVLGKLFLLKYFAKYYEVSGNNFLIDSVWLEIGFKKLGFKDIPANDMGNFKFLTVKKFISTLKSEMTININIEKLFDFIITEFKISNVTAKKNSAEIIEEISKRMVRDAGDNILFYGVKRSRDDESNSNMNNSSVNEFEFRKKLIKSFGFIDHTFFDHIVGFMSKKNQTDFDYDIPKNMNTTIFNLETITKEEWSKLAFNLLFMSLIRNHDKIGLMLEINEIVQLKNIYNNIETKIFPSKNLSQKFFKTVKYKEQNFVYADDKIEINEFKNKSHNMRDINGKDFKLNFDKRNININNIFDQNYPILNSDINNTINLLKFIAETSSVNIKENIIKSDNIGKTIDRKQSPVNIDYSTKSTNIANVNDTANIIPELFYLCADHLKNKYKIEKIDTKILSNLGCCKIFRDHLNSNKLNLLSDINIFLLMSHIKTVPGITDRVFQFMEYYANILKSKNNLINAQYFFMKIEEVLIQFSKINNSIK